MLGDIKSDLAILVGHVPASRSGASLVGSTIIDMAQYIQGSFILSIGTVASGAALAAKLQYSSSSSFGSDVNDDDASTGNTAAMTGLNTASSAVRFHIKLPVDETKRYHRLAVTDSGGAVVYGSTFVGKAKVTPVSYS